MGFSVNDYKLTVLVDGKNTLYRHNYTSNLTSPEGEKTSGVHGMFKDVGNIIKNFRADNIIIGWDKGESRGRLAIYPNYKGDRKKHKDPAVIENLGFQILHARIIFKGLPVKQIALQGIEADDIIGFMCKKLKGRKIVFSNDTDFLQLVDEETSLFFPTKKQLITHKNIDEHLGFDRKHYIMWKSLVGDKSDSIIGIKGIGPARATEIIKGERKLIITPDDKEKLILNKKLITIGSVLNNEDKRLIIDTYKKEAEKEINPILVRKVFRKLGFRHLIANFSASVYVYRQLQKQHQI